MKKIGKLINLVLPFIVISGIIFLLWLLIILINISFPQVNPDSVLASILDIDFGKFLTVSIITSSFFTLIFSLIRMLFFHPKLEKYNIEELIYRFFTIGYALSIIIPMLTVLSYDQFDIIISSLSFIAIFSFVLPKKSIKKFYEKNIKYSEHDREDEQNY